ncbi:MAG: hypothetical protein ACRDZ4_11805 [Egibacteraceae bacterium]
MLPLSSEAALVLHPVDAAEEITCRIAKTLNRMHRNQLEDETTGLVYLRP